jgi:hypothetical protein
VIFMSMIWPFSFILCMLFQTGGVAPLSFPDDVLSAAEKVQMEKESNNVDHRIKIYDSASARIQKNLREAIAKNNFQAVPSNLNKWILLLSSSLKDIESNLKAKKKSRPLINYEIHLRKAIANTQEYKMRAPVEQQDIFESSLGQAETIRKRFVEILFEH